jgi:hypothetical protein
VDNETVEPVRHRCWVETGPQKPIGAGRSLHREEYSGRYVRQPIIGRSCDLI